MTSFPPFQPAGPQLSLHSGVPPSLSADLEEFNIKSLDSAGDWGGISDSMGGSPSPPVGLSSFIFPPAFLSGGGGGVRTGGSCSIVKGSNRDVVPPGVPGFLWSPFLCSESFGRLASSPRSILPEQLHQRDSLSHGDGSLHQGISAGGGLGGIDRSFGRVFSYFGPQKGSKVPSFSMGGPDVSVLRSPIRTVSSPLGFYSSRSGVSASAEVIGDQNSCLLRRLADLGQQSGAVPTECGGFIGSSSVAGFPPKSAEIRSDTLAAICVPGDGFRHYFYDGGPFPGSASPSVSSAVSSGDTGVRFGQGPGLPPWSNGEPLYASAFGPCLEASLSACLPRSFPPSFSGLGFSGSSGGLVYRNDQKVERSLLSVSESAYPFPSGGYDSIHGCFRSEGLGGGHLDLLPLSAEGLWSPEDHLRLHNINLKEMEGVRLCLLHFQEALAGKVVRLFTDNSSVSTYVNRQGGIISDSLSIAAENLLLWCQARGIVLFARHLSGKLNILADMLSRPDAVLQTEWTLCHHVLPKIWTRFFRPHLDLFATRFSHRLPVYVSPVPDGAAWAVDALTLDWSSLQAYAFPPLALLPKVVQKARRDEACLILVAPMWPAQPWFPDLLQMSQGDPLPLNLRKGDLVQPRTGVPHGNVDHLNLHAFLVCSRHSSH